MRLATYLVAGLASLAWSLPILAVIVAMVTVYQGLSTIVMLAPAIAIPGIGLLFSLLVPPLLRCRGHKRWALGAAFPSFAVVFVLVVISETRPSPPVVFLAASRAP